MKESRFYESDDLYNENGFLQEKQAKELVEECNQSRVLTVDNVKVTTKTEYAPYLFNLADLQAYCSKAFKISPANTLSIAQSLYEAKYTTYPRTDCRFLSSAVAEDLRKKGYQIPDRYVDDSKVTDHYAIIPTLQGNPNNLSGLEAKVYSVILKRFQNTMKPPFIYDAVSIVYIHQNKERFLKVIELSSRPDSRKMQKVMILRISLFREKVKPYQLMLSVFITWRPNRLLLTRPVL